MNRKIAALLLAGIVSLSLVSPVAATPLAPITERELTPAELAEHEKEMERSAMAPDSFFEEEEILYTGPYIVAAPGETEVEVPADEMVEWSNTLSESVELIEVDPYDTMVSDAMVSMDISQNFFLACVKENANLYASDKKTTLFTLGKGDSLLVMDEGKSALSPWMAVLVSGGANSLAYIRTDKLVKKGKDILRARDISNISLYCVSLDENVSYRIYDKPSSSGRQIGTLRKAILLPVLWVEGKFAAVVTAGGVGYVRKDCVLIIDIYPMKTPMSPQEEADPAPPLK